MRRPRLSTALAFAAVACVGAVGACNGGSPSQPAAPGHGTSLVAGAGGADAAVAAIPFEANSPAVYVPKVKNLLLGLAATDAEIKEVEGDPTQLKTLIAGWMTQPQYQAEYQAKMLRFFELAFQQTQVAVADFADQSYPRQLVLNSSAGALLLQNASESFARTVLAMIAAGQPLSDAFTTNQLMMTPALMELYAFLDAYQVDDAGLVTERFNLATPGQPITVEASAGPIPIAESLDPSSPNYMHWYDPDLALGPTYLGVACGTDPLVFPGRADILHYLLYGSILATKNAAGASCQQVPGTAKAPQLVASDFDTWSMVTLRPPVGSESPTLFYDLPTLRSTKELVLTLPRLGFFSTPAFFANWQTNTSNQMRVTINQALIVALGSSVDGTDPTVPATTPGLDPMHAPQSSGACFSCHQTLDPTRSIFAATYSWNYHKQTDPTFSSQDGLFAFRSVVKPVASLSEFGTTLAQHPLFPQAWVQKLCFYANSVACDPTDPEFLRVVGVFQSSGYSWNALVQELLSSPLTTYASATQTVTTGGEVVAVSRRDHLCAALNNRLGFTDICGLEPSTLATVKTTIPEIVSGLPSDGYGRGAVAPVLPNQPTLFYRAGTENICEAAAALVIDAKTPQPGVTQWSSAQPDAAISGFVGTVMALAPSDARATQAQTILKSHFTAAVQAGKTPTAALQSTFVAACLAPSAIGIGM